MRAVRLRKSRGPLHVLAHARTPARLRSALGVGRRTAAPALGAAARNARTDLALMIRPMCQKASAIDPSGLIAASTAHFGFAPGAGSLSVRNQTVSGTRQTAVCSRAAFIEVDTSAA